MKKNTLMNNKKETNKNFKNKVKFLMILLINLEDLSIEWNSKILKTPKNYYLKNTKSSIEKIY